LYGTQEEAFQAEWAEFLAALGEGSDKHMLVTQGYVKKTVLAMIGFEDEQEADKQARQKAAGDRLLAKRKAGRSIGTGAATSAAKAGLYQPKPGKAEVEDDSPDPAALAAASADDTGKPSLGNP